MADVIVKFKPVNPNGYERSFYSEDFGGIKQSGVTFNEKNLFIETMSEEAYLHLLDAGEPVQAIDANGNDVDVARPEKSEAPSAEAQRIAEAAEKVNAGTPEETAPDSAPDPTIPSAAEEDKSASRGAGRGRTTPT